MPEPLTYVAQRIREMREILELDAQEVAKSVGLSVETLLKYETGKLDIPISTLYALANLYEVDFTVLLTGDTPRMDTYCLVRNGEGVSVDRYPGYRFQNLAFNFINRTMEPMIVTLEEGQKPAALVTHSGQEFNLVLEGKVEIAIGKRCFVLSEGDSIYFNPAMPHGQRPIDGRARFLTVIQE